ncbi:uncharacterized protein LOC142582015 [Dermacentor variabilis]|uniref:uncharacterized protein LOC142582015 n=1 Tax=Dermacentor variabilis TaxID=34621 RepID=UPI003F5B75C2
MRRHSFGAGLGSMDLLSELMEVSTTAITSRFVRGASQSSSTYSRCDEVTPMTRKLWGSRWKSLVRFTELMSDIASTRSLCSSFSTAHDSGSVLLSLKVISVSVSSNPCV